MKGSANPNALNLGLKAEKSCSRPAVLWDFDPEMWSIKSESFFSVFSFDSRDGKQPNLVRNRHWRGPDFQFGRKQHKLKMENSSNYLVSQPHVKIQTEQHQIHRR